MMVMRGEIYSPSESDSQVPTPPQEPAQFHHFWTAYNEGYEEGLAHGYQNGQNVLVAALLNRGWLTIAQASELTT